MQTLRKSIILCTFFFSIYPKSSYQSEEDDDKNIVLNSPKHISLLSNTNLGLQLSEPGFDLTEDEMVKFKIWPKGIIPYFIDNISFDKTLRERLRSLLDSFNSVTGLGFLELSRPPDDENERWVFFINRRGVLGCEDYTTKSFTNEGVQKVVLGYDCLGAGGGALAATVLALAGVPPQHNAPDRDTHIDVIMDNIVPEKRHLYEILKFDDWLFYHVPYDFLSAGHYDFHKYTLNGSATIVPKKKDALTFQVGESDGISYNDIWKIRMLYNFISLNRKKTKASDCSQIFKPGSKFSEYKVLKKDIIIPRKKPRAYLGLLDKSNEDRSIVAEKMVSVAASIDEERDTLTAKSKLYVRPKKIAKETLADLPDFDTDANPSNKRVKLLGKFNLKQHRYKEKLGLLEDFDTDNANRMARPGKKHDRGMPRKLSKFSIMSDYNTDSQDREKLPDSS